MSETASDVVPDQEILDLPENQRPQAGDDLDFDVRELADNGQHVPEFVSVQEKEMAFVGGEPQILESLSEKPIGEQKFDSAVEVESKDDSGFIDVSAGEEKENHSMEPNEGAEGEVAEAADNGVAVEQRDHGNSTSVNHMEIDSVESNGVADKSTGFADTRSLNGHVLVETAVIQPQFVPKDNGNVTPPKEENVGELSAHAEPYTSDFFLDGYGSGTEEEQDAFMAELERFYKSKCMDFKPPKFYGEALNCLKLCRAVIKLGGYEQVTSCKLWRQVGESFKPPKTCTTISWTFRNFYEKALLEYEKHKIQTGELQVSPPNASEPAGVDPQVGASQGSGSGRARRDAAARAMQGWHSQRLLGNGEVGDPIIKEKGQLKRKKGSVLERGMKVARTNDVKLQEDIIVDDVGEPADWVKINMRRTKDCFEIYALVPGLLREEVQVQSDPAGRLIITGEPEQPDNPWGVTPFKKIITLPSRIDPHQTSAVVTLHGQLFVRAPFEQSDL